MSGLARGSAGAGAQRGLRSRAYSRRVGTVAVTALVVASVVAFVVGSARTSPQPTPLTVAAVVQTVAASDLLPNGHPNPAAVFARDWDCWRGADGAVSVRVSDGVLWLFGDTVTSKGFPHSSAVFLNDDGTLECIGALPAVASVDGADRWYWPASAVSDGKGGAIVFAMLVRRTGSDALDFALEGSAAIQYREGTFGVPIALGAPSATTLWGAAAFRGSDGDVIIYASRITGRTLEFGKEVLVARARGPITDFAGWEFWDGRTWRAGDIHAAVVVPATTGMSSTFGAARTPTGVLLVSKEQEAIGRYVVALTSEFPQGPFARDTLFVAASDIDAFRYAAAVHPEYSQDGSLMVTVCRNPTEWSHALTEPETYRPEFSWVELQTLC